MNRRSFLRGLAVAVVATRVPLSVLPAPLRRESALEYLRREWNRWAAEHGRAPGIIYVSPQLFEAVEDEMTACTRFTDAHAAFESMLMFKGALLGPARELSGWGCRFAAVVA